MKMLWQLKFKAMDTNGGNMLFIGNKQIHLACSHFQQSISPMRHTYDFVWINFIFFFFALSSRRLFFYSISFYLPVYAALFSSRKLADREFLSSTETKLEFVTRDRFFLYHSFVGFIILSHQRFTMEICGHRKKYTIHFRCMCFFFKKNSLSGLTSAQIAAVEQNFFLQKRNRRNIVCIVNMVESNAGFLTT